MSKKKPTEEPKMQHTVMVMTEIEAKKMITDIVTKVVSEQFSAYFGTPSKYVRKSKKR